MPAPTTSLLATRLWEPEPAWGPAGRSAGRVVTSSIDGQACAPFVVAAGIVYGGGSAVRDQQGAALARASLALVQAIGEPGTMLGQVQHRCILALLPLVLPQHASDAERLAIVVCAQFSPPRAAAIEHGGDCRGAMQLVNQSSGLAWSQSAQRWIRVGPR